MPAKPILVDLDFVNAARAVNLPAPVVGGEAANKAYVDARVQQIADSVTGLKWLQSAAVATTANVSLSAAGPVINGVFLTAGMRVLVKNQTNPAENGVYVFDTGVLSRSLDADTANELIQAVITASGGTVGAGLSYRQAESTITLGLTPVTWEFFNNSAPLATTTVPGLIRIATDAEALAGAVANAAITPATLAYALANGLGVGAAAGKAFVIGDGVATSFSCVHDLSTRDVSVTIRQTGTWEEVLAENNASQLDRVIVTFSRAPNPSEFRVLVQPL